jgi:O-acetylserine/cysteine efflux transporter
MFETNRALIYVAVLGTANALWQKISARQGVNKVVPFQLLTSVFGMSIAALFLGDAITMQMLMGALVLIAGLGLATLVKKK